MTVQTMRRPWRKNSNYLMGLPPGAAGTRATLRLMARIAREYRTHEPIRRLAVNIVRYVPIKNYRAEALAVFSFVRARIRYTRDIAGVETVQTPDKTLEIGAGDCDDQAVLVASLMGAIGATMRFTAIGYLPGVYQHVYAEVLHEGRWVPMETTEPWEMGTKPPDPVTEMHVMV